MKKLFIVIIISFCNCFIHAQAPQEDPYYAQSADPIYTESIFDSIKWDKSESLYRFSIFAGEKLAREYIENFDIKDSILLSLEKTVTEEEIGMYFSTESLLRNLKLIYGDSVAYYGYPFEIEEMIFSIAVKNIQFFYQSFFLIRD